MENNVVFLDTDERNRINQTSIMLLRNDGEWEIYYRRPGYPFIFAFGVDCSEQGAALLASANILRYNDLFT